MQPCFNYFLASPPTTQKISQQIMIPRSTINHPSSYNTTEHSPHLRRRNAIVYNNDLTCTTKENGLLPHPLALEPTFTIIEKNIVINKLHLQV